MSANSSDVIRLISGSGLRSRKQLKEMGVFGIEMNDGKALVFDVGGVQVTKIKLGDAVLTEVARNGNADPNVVAQAMAYVPANAQVTGQFVVGDTESPDGGFIIDLLLEEVQGDD
ncbi:hypothetical protein [Streptosporangium sp. NPDC087985]|uniref:hypothetical protein n=1 Tax=Streptosporangium sp. NPDC087985 TaxID=3366196 RepID=UPI0038033144